MRAAAKRRGVRAPVRQELPALPPSAGEGERSTPSSEQERDPDDAVAPEWRDPRTDPPFPLADRQKPHGPYDLLLVTGQIVEARWGMHGTISGGRTWGWILRDRSILMAGKIKGWRAAT